MTVCRSWFELGGQELTNSTRAYDLTGLCSCPSGASSLRVAYRDDWAGLRAWLGDEPYTPEGAPWFDPSRPESAEFAGVAVMGVEGLDTVPVQREVLDSVCHGGVPAAHRDAVRRVRFSAVLAACTAAGLRFGLQWLACRLRETNGPGGMPLRFLAASPEGSSATPDSLVRTLRGAVLTESPHVVGRMRGSGGAAHRQAQAARVEWELASGSPYLWTDPVTVAFDWEGAEYEPLDIVWDTDCAPGGACAEVESVLRDPLCPPPPSLPVHAAAPALGCGTGGGTACLPLCSSVRAVMEFTPAPPGGCDAAVTVTVTNNGAQDVRGLSLAWVPCGGDRECDRLYPADLTYLPAGAELVLDAVTGRVRAVVGGVEMGAPGLVRGAGGGPWAPPLLGAGQCYELVLSYPPGMTDVEVALDVVGRDA